MASLTFHNVIKKFGTRTVLRQLSLDIRDREFFVLVGPSGCGKSLFLRLIAGLEEPTEGRILMDKKPLLGVPPQDRNVAMVFQNYALYPHMSVRENMAFGLSVRGYSREEIDLRVGQAAEMLEITPLLDRRPAEISGGQRQRVAVGRAIVRKPKVFLFDEPLSNLDPQLRVQTRAELLELHRRLQTTMVYVTHDQGEAMTLGQRLAIMEEGALQQVGSPLDLYRAPRNRFTAQFLGTPAMNFVEMVVADKRDRLWVSQGKFDLKLPLGYRRAGLRAGQRVLVGLRPEDIHDRLFEPESDEDNVITGVVQFVEPLGSESYVHLDAGGHRLVARVGADNPVQVNQPMDLAVAMDKVHLFTEDGRERVSPQ
jgi:multiple sugar transport system ATP-binding protein